MTRYRMAPELLLQTVRDEAVILDPRHGDYFTLNDVAARMLQLYRESGDIGQVTERIVDEYVVAAADARQDLEQLLTELAAHDLAEPCD